MPDPRFFEALGPVSLAELAELTGAVLADPAQASRQVRSAAPLVRAGPEAISFLGDRRYLSDLAATGAGACFLREAQVRQAPQGCAVLVAASPSASFGKAALRLFRSRLHDAADPAIHPQAELEAEVVLGHGVVIGPGARIGARTQISANTVIGPGVAVGRDCRIGSNASLSHALVGDRVTILSGVVIGEAGFGVAEDMGDKVDMPQLGRVILQDGVTVGAGSCVDRGAWDDTVVGENTKIDNLVQIAHNVRIGRNCVVAGQSGISGSVTVGDQVQLGGRAGIADHLEVGDGARIAAAAGVMNNIPAGETWGGAPARPLRQFLRETAWLMRRVSGQRRTTADD